MKAIKKTMEAPQKTKNRIFKKNLTNKTQIKKKHAKRQ